MEANFGNGSMLKNQKRNDNRSFPKTADEDDVIENASYGKANRESTPDAYYAKAANNAQKPTQRKRDDKKREECCIHHLPHLS